MSDMSRPRSLPPASDHAQHDTLLVAQLATADDLSEEQRQAASGLVASCSECAALAADLRAIQRAVAWEPAPPRRRDHRLSPGQAERLRGSPVRRFLRRLALPEAGALRPLAAGVLSVGLLFVVAGTVWPEDLLSAAGDIPVAAPQQLQVAPSPGDAGPATLDATPAQAAVEALEAETGTDPDAGDSAADGVLPEMAVGEAEPSLADRSDEGALADDATRSGLSRANEADTGTAKATDLQPAEQAEAVPESFESRATESLVPEPPRSESLQATAAGGEGDVVRDRAGTVAADAVEELTPETDRAFETTLIGIGSLLVLGGLALLLLVWLARRLTRDPLLR